MEASRVAVVCGWRGKSGMMGNQDVEEGGGRRTDRESWGEDVRQRRADGRRWGLTFVVG